MEVNPSLVLNVRKALRSEENVNNGLHSIRRPEIVARVRLSLIRKTPTLNSGWELNGGVEAMKMNSHLSSSLERLTEGTEGIGRRP